MPRSKKINFSVQGAGFALNSDLVFLAFLLRWEYSNMKIVIPSAGAMTNDRLKYLVKILFWLEEAGFPRNDIYIFVVADERLQYRIYFSSSRLFFFSVPSLI